MATIHSIRRLYRVIDNSVFCTTGHLDYDRVTDAVITLADAVHTYFNGPNAPKFEGFEVWYIGEGGECTLSDFIIGAYWHYCDWHSGQWSKGYRALSALGRVFDPGFSSIETERADGSSAAEAYDMLASMAQ